MPLGDILKNLFKQRSRLRAKSFGNREVNTWNSLPESVVTAPSLSAFKNSLNIHWKRHPHKLEPACYSRPKKNNVLFPISSPICHRVCRSAFFFFPLLFFFFKVKLRLVNVNVRSVHKFFFWNLKIFLLL